MNEIDLLLNRFKSNTQTWSDYQEFLDLPESKIKKFFKLVKKITIDNFNNKLKIYIPNKRFPAISITGSECSLNCEHCNKKYLNGMKDLRKNEDLKKFLYTHYENNGIGVLISGGCDPNGAVPLGNFIDTIKEIKQNTELIINVHTGLLTAKTAKALADANVDIISFDITMDESAIKEIYHLNKDNEDYKKALEVLKEHNLNIVPHICVGLYYGRLHKELAVLRYIRESGLNPSLMVIIALIPPKRKSAMFKE
ncbi:MAG: radical SAM protein, partial [Candidatus Thorarchaeota archaeon]